MLIKIELKDRDTVLINPDDVSSIEPVRGSIGLDRTHHVIHMKGGRRYATYMSESTLLKAINHGME